MVALKIAQQAMPEPGWLLGPVAVAKFYFAVKLLASLFLARQGQERRVVGKGVRLCRVCGHGRYLFQYRVPLVGGSGQRVRW